jgi:hypothetical protein
MELTSSQQSSIKSANPNISPYSLLLYFLFFFLFVFFFLFFFLQVILFLQLFVCAYDLDKQPIEVVGLSNCHDRSDTVSVVVTSKSFI